MTKRGWSRYCYALVFFVVLGSAVCFLPSKVYAGGVYLGFGVDVPSPGTVVAPPVPVYHPPVVVERTPQYPPVVVERTAPPPPVVIRRTAPAVVYDGPVVIERHTTVTYYPPSYQYRTYREETEREYYRQRSQTWEDSD